LINLLDSTTLTRKESETRKSVKEVDKDECRNPPKIVYNFSHENAAFATDQKEIKLNNISIQLLARVLFFFRKSEREKEKKKIKRLHEKSIQVINHRIKKHV
jgi:hypothetical protein